MVASLIRNRRLAKRMRRRGHLQSLSRCHTICGQAADGDGGLLDTYKELAFLILPIYLPALTGAGARITIGPSNGV